HYLVPGAKPVEGTTAEARMDSVRNQLDEKAIEALKYELEDSLDYFAAEYDKLDQEIGKQSALAKALVKAELEDDEHKGQISSTQELKQILAKRMDEVRVLKDTERLKVDTIFDPGTGRQVAPRATFVFPTAMLLGLMAGVGLAFLVEVSDQSFRTPDEIRRRLGLPVMGHVPFHLSEDE